MLEFGRNLTVEFTSNKIKTTELKRKRKKMVPKMKRFGLNLFPRMTLLCNGCRKTFEDDMRERYRSFMLPHYDSCGDKKKTIGQNFEWVPTF